MRVSPFGYLRIEAHLQLPAAYRSLSRPSSAPCAKAFTLCSCSLELILASSSLYELLEFHKTNNLFGCQFSVKRFYPFCFESFSTFRWNCNLPKFGKTQLISQFCPLLSVRFLTHFHPNFFEFFFTYSIVKFHVSFRTLVGLDGLEPSTSRLSGVRSNHLSYRPFSFGGRFGSRSSWWRWRESNPWPPACRAGALPAELHPR